MESDITEAAAVAAVVLRNSLRFISVLLA